MLSNHCNAAHSTRANNNIQLYCNEIWKIVLSQKPHAGINIGWLFCCAHNAKLTRFGTVKCNDDHWYVHSAHPNEINCGESAYSCLFRCEPVEEYRVFAIIYRAKKKYSRHLVGSVRLCANYFIRCICVPESDQTKCFASAHSHQLTSLFYFIISCVHYIVRNRVYWFSKCSFLLSIWLECNQILHITSQILVVLCHFSCFTIISTTRTTATQNISTLCFYTLFFYFNFNLSDAFISIPLSFNSPTKPFCPVQNIFLHYLL